MFVAVSSKSGISQLIMAHRTNSCQIKMAIYSVRPFVWTW